MSEWTCTPRQILTKYGFHRFIGARSEIQRAAMTGMCKAVLAEGAPDGGNEVELANAAFQLAALFLAMQGAVDTPVSCKE